MATTIRPRISDGKRQQHVHDLHDDGVDAPAVPAGDQRRSAEPMTIAATVETMPMTSEMRAP